MTLRGLTIIATTRCTLRCEYCYLAAKRERPPAEFSSARRALEQLLQRASAELQVTITGGEPLLVFPRVKEIVRRVQDTRPPGTRVRWKLLTNGLLLDDENLAFLDTHDFTVRLSFDGVPPAQALRGADTFTRLDALLDTLRTRYPRLFRERLELSTVLTPATVADFGASVEYFLKKDVKDVAVAPALGARGWAESRIAGLEAAFTRASDASLRHYRATGEVPITLFRQTRRDAADASEGMTCGATDSTRLAIDVDGLVYGCVLATASYQAWRATPPPPAVAALRVGRPDAATFEHALERMPLAAWASGGFDHPEQRYSSYRHCSECEYLGRCRVCPLATACESQPGDPRHVPDFQCAFNLVSLAHRDRFPCQPDGYGLLTGAVPLPLLPV